MASVVLAYSGGLDTSCILAWLVERGHKVVAFMANVGQEEDFEAATAKARAIGAVKVVVSDLRAEFVEGFVVGAVGARYEERYLLGTALARPCIARGLVRCARAEGARFFAHGATGKGNDQVRFELACRALRPSLQVIAPWRMKEFYERFQGRSDLFRYAQEKNIPVPVTPSAPWSTDANLMHISYESGVLEDPWAPPPPSLFQMTRSPESAPDRPALVVIEFLKGVPVKVRNEDDESMGETPLEMFLYLNKIGSEHGIGRIDIVENRFLGIKSRGVYETPGGTILQAAFEDLQLYTLDKEVYKMVKYISLQFAEQIYNGLWFSPECEFSRSCLQLSRASVSGEVRVRLFKGQVSVLGRRSPSSIYNQELSSMDKHGDFSPEDADGFIRIHALRLSEYYRSRQTTAEAENSE